MNLLSQTVKIGETNSKNSPNFSEGLLFLRVPLIVTDQKIDYLPSTKGLSLCCIMIHFTICCVYIKRGETVSICVATLH